MATDDSTVAQNENTIILRGIGGATADLPKSAKNDCKDTKDSVDLPKPAKHLESEEVEASSLKRKSSQQGTETTKWAKTRNILTGDLSLIGHASPPVEKIDADIKILQPRMELPTISPPNSAQNMPRSQKTSGKGKGVASSSQAQSMPPFAPLIVECEIAPSSASVTDRVVEELHGGNLASLRESPGGSLKRQFHGGFLEAIYLRL